MQKWRKPYIPSWPHSRFTMIYIVSTTIILFNLFLSNKSTDSIYNIILAILWFIFFVIEWNISIWVAANFLTLKYGKEKNPFGIIITIIGTIFMLTNYALFYFDALNFYTNQFGIFFVINLIIFIVISITLEFIHLKAGCHFAFIHDSSVAGGIYGFLKGFSRITFQIIYDLIKYVLIVIIILIQLFDDKYMFYVVPIGLELCLFGLFMTGKDNRPDACKCCQIYCWRPYVEYFYGKACTIYKERNPNSGPTQDPMWIDSALRIEMQK